MTDEQGFFAKAQEGLAAATAALDAGWYTVCVRNAYYAAYQAAIAALISEIVRKEKRSEAIQRHAEELQALIRTRYPEAEFHVSRRQEPVRGIWIETYIDDEDGLDPIFDQVTDRILDILINEKLHFIVIPLPKPAPEVKFAS